MLPPEESPLEERLSHDAELSHRCARTATALRRVAQPGVAVRVSLLSLIHALSSIAKTAQPGVAVLLKAISRRVVRHEPETMACQRARALRATQGDECDFRRDA